MFFAAVDLNHCRMSNASDSPERRRVAKAAKRSQTNPNLSVGVELTICDAGRALVQHQTLTHSLAHTHIFFSVPTTDQQPASSSRANTYT